MLSVKGLAWTGGILWAVCVLLVGLLNLIWPGYGVDFLDLARSVYPGYAHTEGIVGVIVGTLYALVDGAVAGAVFAWLYNKMAGGGAAAQE